MESLYILWRTTGDVRWRHHGWAIFQAIERETKTSSGYASADKVETSPVRHLDSMPRSEIFRLYENVFVLTLLSVASYFLAET